MPYLKDKPTTCHVGFPIKKGEIPNVISVFDSDTLDHCERMATNIAKDNPQASFFTWSSKSNPIGGLQTPTAETSINSNCFVFKTCLETNATPLKNPGNTYQLKKRMFYIFLIFFVN